MKMLFSGVTLVGEGDDPIRSKMSSYYRNQNNYLRVKFHQWVLWSEAARSKSLILDVKRNESLKVGQTG